jgi:hypothetical protein
VIYLILPAAQLLRQWNAEGETPGMSLKESDHAVDIQPV